MKSGRSDSGAAAAHTGSAAGGDGVYEVIFRRAGIIRAAQSNELVHAYNTILSNARKAEIKGVRAREEDIRGVQVQEMIKGTMSSSQGSMLKRTPGCSSSVSAVPSLMW